MVLALKRQDWPAYGAAIQALEDAAEYPYGDDVFKLDHGPSYFDFFARLGEPVFHVAVDGPHVVACAAGVLRTIPGPRGPLRSWYLCDLKVHPEYRSQRLPARLFRHKLFANYLRCRRAYGVSMNPPGRENRVVPITQKFPYIPIRRQAQLNFYSLNWPQMTAFKDEIIRVVGQISYLSLAGKKDLILRRTGARLDLLHVQHGPLAEHSLREPRKGATHMICAPPNSALDLGLSSRLPISATASLIAYRMKPIDWSFLLTSDI